MDKTHTIVLTDEELNTLIDELTSLHGYHWNDDSFHADDCGSKVLAIIQEQRNISMQRGMKFRAKQWFQ